MTEPYSFSDVLRELRTEKGYTQKELARKLNLSFTAVSKYELGEALPTFDTIKTLAVIFNVSADKLLGLEKRDKLSMYGLTEEQSQLIHDLAELLRNKNTSMKNKLSDEQYKMLGRITACFMEK